MKYQLTRGDGTYLDARFEINKNSVYYLSRGGAKDRGAKNVDYSDGLRLLVERLRGGSITIKAAYVDSIPTQKLRLSERTILRPGEGSLAADKICTLLQSRQKKVNQEDGVEGGNQTRKLRIDLDTELEEVDLVRVLGGVPAEELARLSDEQLELVTAEHIWKAIQQLLTDDSEHKSDRFELLVEGDKRLSPKAVFRLAATEALGFAVQSRQFLVGMGTPCFRILERSGFGIVRKGKPAPAEDIPISPDDLEWSEGKPKLVSHLRRERAKGLAQAKRAEFKREHRRLFCESCKMDPVKTYDGPEGESCIEVHHAFLQVKDMEVDHATKLEHLQCLCANCHRVVHRRTKLDLARADR